jgi:hypothetical protein
VTSKRLPKRHAELTWNQRATIIFFYYHERLGKKDAVWTAKVYLVSKPNTIVGWLRESLAHKWYPIVRQLSLESVLEAIPDKRLRELYLRQMFKQKEPNIPRMYRITCPSGPGLLLHIVPATKETRTIVVAAKNEGALVLKKDARRATRGNDPAKREHLEVHLYVEQVVTKRWEQGDAIGREELKEKVKSKFIKSNQTNFINSYLDPDKKGSFAKFITRSI